MKRNAHILIALILALVVLGGCSSKPPAGETKKAAPQLLTIRGQAQVLMDTTGDAQMNSGGPSLYFWEGKKRYRLFPRKTMELVQGGEYIVEGIHAQKVIEEIGDPDQGKGGYPLLSSCERVVRMAWSGLPFDEADVKASVLKTRLARYPARAILLVVRIKPVKPTEEEKKAEEAKKKAAAAEEELPIVPVPYDKQKALLVEGKTSQTAPLWQPTGGTAKCKILIGPSGTITDLETGVQLCEAVDWTTFKFQPTLQKGKAVNVRTEVDVTFEARK